MNPQNTNTGSSVLSFGTDPFTANPRQPVVGAGAIPSTTMQGQHNNPEGQPKKPLDEVKDKGAHAVEDAKHKATEVVDSVKQQLSEAAESAKESGRQYAEEKKKLLAAEVRVFSGAIRKASNKLREEEHASIANYVDAAVEQLDHLSDSLQNRTLSGIVDDLQCVARRRPEIVYGASLGSNDS